MSDEPQVALNDEPMCDHICLLPDRHVEEGRPHFYGYRLGPGHPFGHTRRDTAMTKRRYAHEIYPHPDECEVRPLKVEVPYLYARALGFRVDGTSWFEPFRDPATGEINKEVAKRSGDRTNLMIAARERALIADALLQGLGGQDAWEWAENHNDVEGEWVWERAVHYGVDPDAIKPYPCGPEPDHHDHWTPRDAHGVKTLIGHRVPGKESECAECCEPEEQDSALPPVAAPVEGS